MKIDNLTEQEVSVLNAVKEQPLTSFEILNKVESISMILSLYNVIDELKDKGAIKTYTKESIKYHIAC